VSLASEILEDAEEEPVDVTEACEPRGDELLLAGEARLGDVSDAGRLDSWVVRLWTERSRSDRIPLPPLTELYGVTQNEAWLVTRLEWVGVLPSMLQHKQLRCSAIYNHSNNMLTISVMAPRWARKNVAGRNGCVDNDDDDDHNNNNTLISILP